MGGGTSATGLSLDFWSVDEPDPPENTTRDTFSKRLLDVVPSRLE